MNRSGCFLSGLLVGAALTFVGLKYHVVRANDGVHFVPKITADFRETYLDIRKFSATDWNQHRALAAAIMRSNQPQLMQASAENEIRSGVDRAFEDWKPTQ